jgi:hypothetical protein
LNKESEDKVYGRNIKKLALETWISFLEIGESKLDDAYVPGSLF